MAKRKFPNGFGGITKLSGNRTKPFMAYKTDGWHNNGRQIKKPIGYAERYEEALQMLLDYNKNPYDIDCSKLTYGQVCAMVLKDLKKDVDKKKFSIKSFNLYQASYKNHCDLLKDIIITDVKKRHIQQQIDETTEGNSTKRYIKNLASKVYSYSIDELDLDLNKDFSKNVVLPEEEKSKLHTNISEKEILKLWENSSDFYVKLILIMIYTGLRPIELLSISNNNVFLNKRYMIGGVKTSAGKNRIIPICHKILPIIQELYISKNKFLATGTKNTKITYKTLLSNVCSTFQRLNMEYLPYDCRHTFATRMHKINADRLIIKVIMGHSTKDDVTEDVYIHIDINDLLKEVDKLS